MSSESIFHSLSGIYSSSCFNLSKFGSSNWFSGTFDNGFLSKELINGFKPCNEYSNLTFHLLKEVEFQCLSLLKSEICLILDSILLRMSLYFSKAIPTSAILSNPCSLNSPSNSTGSIFSVGKFKSLFHLKLFHYHVRKFRLFLNWFHLILEDY